MAEPLDDAAIQRLADEQERAMQRHIAYLSMLEKNNKDSLANFLKEKKNWAERDAALKEFIKQTKTISGPNALGGFIKGVKGSFAALADVSDDLKILESVIEKTTDAEEKRLLGVRREELVKKSINSMLLGSAVDFAGSLRKLAIGGIANTTSSFVRGLQNNSSATELSSTLMNGAVDLTTGAITRTGEALSKAGEITSGFGGKAKWAGIAAQGLGMGLTAFADSANKLVKFGIEVLSKEVEKTVKSFNDASSSGALFADGMTGMRNAAGAAGLTVEQFSGVVKQYSSDIAASGMGVTEGSRRIGGALSAGGNSLKTNLLNLGYGFEEQAGLVAEVMKDMRGSGGPLRASNAQVAAQTEKYAENLRTITAITGEDAKKKMEAVRQQASQLAFQQKLAGMDEKQRTNIVNAMGNMSELERKNFMDMMNFGSVINKEGAVAAALSKGLSDSVNASYQAAQDGTLDEIKQRQITSQYGDQIKKDLLLNVEIATAQAAGIGGLIGSLGEILGKELEFRNRFNKDSIEASENSVKSQKETNDKLTKSVSEAADAAQKLKISLEKELTSTIGEFANISLKMLKLVQDQLKELGLGETKKEPGLIDKYGRGALEYGGAAIGAGVGAVAGGIAGFAQGSVVPVVGNVVGAGVGGVSGGALGGTMGYGFGKTIADFFNLPSYAQGGITKGLSLAGEAGPEAVIPLDNNRSVPVKLDLSKFEKPINRSDLLPAESKINLVNKIDVALPKFDTPLNKIDFSIPDFSKEISNSFSKMTDSILNMTENNKPISSVEVVTEEKSKFDAQAIDLLKEQINLMKEFISNSGEHLEALRDSKYLQQQLVNNSYS